MESTPAGRPLTFPTRSTRNSGVANHVPLRTKIDRQIIALHSDMPAGEAENSLLWLRLNVSFFNEDSCASPHSTRNAPSAYTPTKNVHSTPPQREDHAPAHDQRAGPPHSTRRAASAHPRQTLEIIPRKRKRLSRLRAFSIMVAR